MVPSLRRLSVYASSGSAPAGLAVRQRPMLHAKRTISPRNIAPSPKGGNGCFPIPVRQTPARTARAAWPRARLLPRHDLVHGNRRRAQAYGPFLRHAQGMFGFGHFRNVQAGGGAEAESGGQITTGFTPPFAQIRNLDAEARLEQTQGRSVVEGRAANMAAATEGRDHQARHPEAKPDRQAIDIFARRSWRRHRRGDMIEHAVILIVIEDEGRLGPE